MQDRLRVILTSMILVISPSAIADRISTPMQTWFLQSACEPKETRYAKGFCEGAHRGIL